MVKRAMSVTRPRPPTTRKHSGRRCLCTNAPSLWRRPDLMDKALWSGRKANFPTVIPRLSPPERFTATAVRRPLAQPHGAAPPRHLHRRNLLNRALLGARIDAIAFTVKQ